MNTMQNVEIANGVLALETGKETTAMEQPKMEDVAVVTAGASLFEMIPEDARAEEGIPENVKGYVEQGLFQRTAGMGKIVNKFDGKVFAYVFVNEKGKREIHFLEQRDDGSCSPEFVISQSDLLMATMGTQVPDKELEREAQKCQRKIIRDYMGMCDRQGMPKIKEIIQVLSEILGQLPVVYERHEMSRPELYSEVMDKVKTVCEASYQYCRRSGYIQLMDYDVEAIATEMGFTKLKLLELLKKNQLLYLTNSCRGYQVKVPIGKDRHSNTVFAWRYCLLDLEYYSRKLDPVRNGTEKELDAPLENLEDY